MIKLKRGNIYSKIPPVRKKELLQSLLATKKFKIERIVSQGQSTPNGTWLTDARDEWVMVVKGAGVLRFRKNKRVIQMKAGDYLFIPARTGHRVEETAAKEKTIWLVVYSSLSL